MESPARAGEARTLVRRSVRELPCERRRLRCLPALALVLAGACRVGVAPAQPGEAPTGGLPSGGGPPAGPPVLAHLAVSGGGALYPAFAADVHHYALPCDDPATLRVVARAGAATTRLTLLRDDPGRNHVATHRLDQRLTVADDRDVAIEASCGAARTTYVVHCLPADFPRIRVLKKTAAVSEGLLFVHAAARLHGDRRQQRRAEIPPQG